MKHARLTQRKRYSVWKLRYYIDGKRKKKSLTTTDKITASIRFTELTGFPAEEATKLVRGFGKPKVLFVKAVNKFIKSKWGIQNAWMAKSKAQCCKRSTLGIGIFKKLQAFGNICYIDDVTFDTLHGYVASLHHSEGIRGGRGEAWVYSGPY